ncbi:MAG TPA: hypothetical protein VFP98_10140 [Candidatus Polarisedimenticolia bacterium]|nr:hypothetical protein [Candidatus Polarisedimenticolia bacterium]
MDLAGKYLIAGIKDVSARVLFDLPAEASESRAHRQWTFVGKVEGETANVGVWLSIEEVATPDGMVTAVSKPYTVLIRWDWIVTAVVSSEKPVDLTSVKSVTLRSASG